MTRCLQTFGCASCEQQGRSERDSLSAAGIGFTARAREWSREPFLANDMGNTKHWVSAVMGIMFKSDVNVIWYRMREISGLEPNLTVQPPSLSV